MHLTLTIKGAVYSLNLVVCKASKITAVRNMIDTCHQAYLYFHNSPKRQRFLEVIIDHFCPSSKKKKINGLCKTRWVERHHTFSAIHELYPYLINVWDETCNPSTDNEKLYPKDEEKWNWDTESRSSANGLRHVFCSFDHIAAFMSQGWEFGAMALQIAPGTLALAPRLKILAPWPVQLPVAT